jgi:hypothetical protein
MKYDCAVMPGWGCVGADGWGAGWVGAEGVAVGCEAVGAAGASMSGIAVDDAAICASSSFLRFSSSAVGM